MHLVLYLLVLGSALSSATAQTSETGMTTDLPSTSASISDVQRDSNTTIGSTQSPNPTSDSTTLQSTLSTEATTHSNHSNATHSFMGTTAIYTSTMAPVETLPSSPAATEGIWPTKEAPTSGISTATVVVIIIILIIVVALIIFCCVRTQLRRDSADLRSGMQEDAEVPLSTMEAEGVANISSRNGMQTFTGATAIAEDPTLVTHAEKGQEDKGKPDDDSNTRPASGTSGEDKPGEQAPVEETQVKKTDNERKPSQTLVELLQEPSNVNNNNNNNNSMPGPTGGSLHRSFSLIHQDDLV